MPVNCLAKETLPGSDSRDSYDQVDSSWPRGVHFNGSFCLSRLKMRPIGATQRGRRVPSLMLPQLPYLWPERTFRAESRDRCLLASADIWFLCWHSGCACWDQDHGLLICSMQATQQLLDNSSMRLLQTCSGLGLANEKWKALKSIS